MWLFGSTVHCNFTNSYSHQPCRMTTLACHTLIFRLKLYVCPTPCTGRTAHSGSLGRQQNAAIPWQKGSNDKLAVVPDHSATCPSDLPWCTTLTSVVVWFGESAFAVRNSRFGSFLVYTTVQVAERSYFAYGKHAWTLPLQHNLIVSLILPSNPKLQDSERGKESRGL
jgi:hypothetical protein